MEQAKTIVIRVLALLAAFLWLLPAVGEAKTFKITCSATKKIGSFLTKVKPGDVIQVSGTCNENVVIPEQVQNITLDGQGTATINGAITIRGRGITIKRFTITGGDCGGIEVIKGGTAVIDGNTIQDTGCVGIGVRQNSYALITNNTVQNNSESGIVVETNSSADIGLMDGDSVGPNTIQNNGGDGIHVEGSSKVFIVGNVISGNSGGGGIHITLVSHAHIASNTINNNTDGINVSENSGVNLGNDAGTGTFESPNTTTVNNGGFGIRCGLGGYVDGRLGTLNGDAGAKDFDSTCVDSLIP